MIDHQLNNEVVFDISYSYVYNEEKYPVIKIGNQYPMAISDTLYFYYSCN